MVRELIDQLRQLGNEGGLVEGIAQPRDHLVAHEDPAHQLAGLGVGHLHGRRVLVQVADQAREDGLQVWVVLVAVGIGGTALEEDII